MKLATAATLIAAACVASPALAWTVSRSTSPVDDSPTVSLSRAAHEEVFVRYDTYRPMLVVRCRENRTSLYIRYGFFLTTDQMRVTTRVDKEKARTSTWQVSTNYESVGLWRGGGSIPFIKSLLGKDRLFVRVQPHGESAVDVTFSLKELDRKIEMVSEACGWDASQTPKQPSANADVRTAQRRLAVLGYEPGVADGVMGPRTRSAIRQFQLDAGMTPTGELDGNTLEAIKAPREGEDPLKDILDSVNSLESRI